MKVYTDTIYIGVLIFLAFFIFIFLLNFLYQYRRNGFFSFKDSSMFFLFILYIEIAYFMVILPLPDLSTFPAKAKPLIEYMQLNLMYFINEIVSYFHDHTLSLKAFIKAPPVYTTFFNILLLYPLGVFLRNFFNFTLRKTIIIAFFVSLSFELLQLSGLLFIYPHPYRLFDVDDLVMNTFGAFLGAISYKLFSFLFMKREENNLYEFKPTMFKQFIIIICDIILLFIIKFIMLIVFRAIMLYLFNYQISTVDNFSIIVDRLIVIGYFIVPILSKKYQTMAMKVASLYLYSDNDNIIKRIVRTTLVYVPFILPGEYAFGLIGIIFFIYICYFIIHLFIRRNNMNLIDRLFNYQMMKLTNS